MKNNMVKHKGEKKEETWLLTTNNNLEKHDVFFCFVLFFNKLIPSSIHLYTSSHILYAQFYHLNNENKYVWRLIRKMRYN